MANLSQLVPIVPMALLVGSIVCLPLLADSMPGSDNREQRATREKVSVRVSRGVTVPYISRQRRDQ